MPEWKTPIPKVEVYSFIQYYSKRKAIFGSISGKETHYLGLGYIPHHLSSEQLLLRTRVSLTLS